MSTSTADAASDDPFPIKDRFLIIMQTQCVGRAGRVTLALALVGCLGCAGEPELATYPAVVKVSFPNGDPIPGAQVTLRSKDQPKVTAYGRADDQGVCRLATKGHGEGAILGDHQAVVAAPVGGGDLDDVQLTKISGRFANYSTSGLEFTVTENEADNQFEAVVTEK